MPHILGADEVIFDYLVASHAHFDHFDPDRVPTLLGNGKTKFIGAKDTEAECERLGIKDNLTFISVGDKVDMGGAKLTAVRCDHGPDTPHAVGLLFEIEGKKIFTMGGGYSIDKAMRREGFSWWSDEMPSNEDYREATRNLREHSFAVDIIISHTAPSEIVYAMGSSPDLHEIELNGFFDWILHEVSFDKWYFGHWHRDEEYYGKFRAVYFDVLKI